jgi:hypothetical protein
MHIDALDDFIAGLSAKRFERYLAWAKGDAQVARDLYLLNCRLCEALYTPLQMLEIVLRNRIHDVATEMRLGDPSRFWFDRPEFQRGYRQREKVASARQELTRENKTHSPDRIVAALNFGYWTSFLATEYETLWQQGLHKIAKRPDGKGLRRKAFSATLLQIRFLRNRIAHHEPVIYWNLGRHHDEILKLTDYLSPPIAQWVDRHSRFREVYPKERIRLHTEA